MRPLTRLQSDVLFVVAEHEPVTASEVDRHLWLHDGRSRSVLAGLERRSLIDATYTNVRPGHRGRGWQLTEKGRVAAARIHSGEEA